MKPYWVSGCIDPCILDIGTDYRWVASFKPRPLYSREKEPPGNLLIGGWVGPRTGLDDVKRRKILPLTGQETPTPRPSSPYSVAIPTALVWVPSALPFSAIIILILWSIVVFRKLLVTQLVNKMVQENAHSEQYGHINDRLLSYDFYHFPSLKNSLVLPSDLIPLCALEYVRKWWEHSFLQWIISAPSTNVLCLYLLFDQNVCHHKKSEAYRLHTCTNWYY
jgi:hypothetical protein